MEGPLLEVLLYFGNTFASGEPKKAFLNLYLVSHDSPICRTLVAFETEDSILLLLSKVTVTIA